MEASQRTEQQPAVTLSGSYTAKVQRFRIKAFERCCFVVSLRHWETLGGTGHQEPFWDNDSFKESSVVARAVSTNLREGTCEG